jgi:error-prone DNA polymerase
MADRQVIEWDKDDIDELKFMKVDVLALGMLTCVKKAFDLLADHKGVSLDLATIPAEDPRTYAMIRKADTLGTFQIESRAQMSMLPRIKPRTFYDLVVEVAIVRPGSIQGDMVHPYLRRREGLEPVVYPKPELEKVLGKTLGVPLFQEQAMRVAIVCAGFTPGEADQLRKSMATFKFTGGVSHFRDKLIAGMVANDYEEKFAEQTFRQLEGFGSYGFPESHAASFALIAYASAWVKCWHPDVFCAALLNSQPMGFYAPAQIVRDAEAHGVEIRPVCVNASRWDCTLEPKSEEEYFAVRLGTRMVKGLANADAETIIAARADQEFRSIDDLWRRAGAPSTALVQLAEADAFRPSLGLARREALWAIKALRDAPLPLFSAAMKRENEPVPEIDEPTVVLKPMTDGHEVVQDYGHVGLTLRRHPVAFLREDLAARRIVACAAAMQARDGRWLEAAGLVLVRQRPGSAKGVLFITLEDETGIANLVVWPKTFETFRRVVMGASMIAVHGRVQREGEVVHLVAHRLKDLSAELASIGSRDSTFPLPHGRGDQAVHAGGGPDPRDAPPRSFRGRDMYVPDLLIDRLKTKSRNFR